MIALLMPGQQLILNSQDENRIMFVRHTQIGHLLVEAMITEKRGQEAWADRCEADGHCNANNGPDRKIADKVSCPELAIFGEEAEVDAAGVHQEQPGVISHREQ